MPWKTPVALLKRYMLLVCLLAGMTAECAIAEEAPAATRPGRIMVLGDSLSAEYGLPHGTGWVKLLEDRLNQRQKAYQIRNASISGDTTIGGLQRLPGLLETFKPDIVILQLGANDGLRGQPVDEMKRNLAEMVSLGRDQGAQVLLVGQHIPQNYGRRYAERFHSAYAELASETGTPLVPFMLEGFAEDSTMFQADGLHPTVAAQKAILDTIWTGLEPLLDPSNARLTHHEPESGDARDAVIGTISSPRPQ